jgi:hypothetical protein
MSIAACQEPSHPHKFLVRTIVMAFLVSLSGATAVAAQQAGVSERVEGLKANMAASNAALRHYQWIETTVINLHGEEKASFQKQCYYGADGVLQKVDIGPEQDAKQPGGVRGRVMARKKAEMTDYMQSAVALIKTYVPPEPAKIQAVKDAGNVSIQPEANGLVRLSFKNYEKPGDLLAMELDVSNEQPKGIHVASYLDTPNDAVTLDVVMSQLDDGTSYAASTTLNASAKNLVVKVSNSGYQKTTR